MRWLDAIIDSVDMGLTILWEILKDSEAVIPCCSPWGLKQLDTTDRLNKNKMDRQVDV